MTRLNCPALKYHFTFTEHHMTMADDFDIEAMLEAPYKKVSVLEDL